MNISQIYDWTTYVLNKYQSGSLLSPDEFNLACKVISRELFNVKVGLPEMYQPGAPYPPQAWQVTQKITDDLKPFIKDTTIDKSQGFFPLPSDYAAFSSLSYKYILNSTTGGNPYHEQNYIDVVTDSELRVRLADNVIMPTLKYPVATYRASGILIYPEDIARVTLTYLRYPLDPVFGYTVSNDEYIYDPSASVQVEFPETLHPEFCMRIARYAGINTREFDVEQTIRERLKTGQ